MFGLSPDNLDREHRLTGRQSYKVKVPLGGFVPDRFRPQLISGRLFAGPVIPETAVPSFMSSCAMTYAEAEGVVKGLWESKIKAGIFFCPEW